MKKGKLISFEGLDGAGKTTQIEMLENWLKKRGIPYLRTREPGGTDFGREIRELLLSVGNPALKIDPLAEALLFQADRAQHFSGVILPALQEGKHVITDRCFDASIAYQGYARGLGAERIEALSMIATQGHKPDLTIFLDLDPKQVYKRVGVQLSIPFDEEHNRNGVREEPNRLDTEAQSFHRRVREGFLALARDHPERIKTINASHSIQAIHQKIVAQIKLLLNDNPKPKRGATKRKPKQSRLKDNLEKPFLLEL